MKRAFVFDVDGTLTASRQTIEPEHHNILDKLIREESVYLITGSDYEKTAEQLLGLQDKVLGSYNCAGNNLWFNGKEIYRNKLEVAHSFEGWCYELLDEQEWTFQSGEVYEKRNGMINLSPVGRPCSMELRKKYVEHDKKTNEREKMAIQINENFPDLEAFVAGETGIDIFMKGKHKGQVYDILSPHYDIIFFGDKCDLNGNDYPFVQKLRSQDKLHHVKNHKETYDIIEKYYVKPDINPLHPYAPLPNYSAH
tara:strand:- start:2568 stop:3326 length:759 start_codon:yes stop_codon:yes gene_type:complete